MSVKLNPTVRWLFDEFNFTGVMRNNCLRSTSQKYYCILYLSYLLNIVIVCYVNTQLKPR